MTSNREMPGPLGGGYSGQIIGAVVKALDIDHIALKSRTAQRFFAGRPVNEYNRNELLEGLGDALIQRGIVPVLPGIDECDVTMAQVIGGVIGIAAMQWDELLSDTQSRSAAIEDRGMAVERLLRLIVVELAVRIFALLRLAGLEPPEPGTPRWAQENGGGRLLRRLAENAGLTRAQLAARMEVSYTSVDNWFDGNHRPTAENIAALAHELANPAQGQTAPQLAQEIQRQFTFAHLADLLAPLIGRDKVIELSATLIRFVREITADVRRMKRRPIEESAGAELRAFYFGTAYQPTHTLLRNLAQREPDAGWKRDIMAAAVDWTVPFQEIAGLTTSSRSAAGLAQDLTDLSVDGATPVDPAQEALPQLAVETTIQDYQRMGMADPSLFFQKLDTGIAMRRRIVRDYPDSPQAHFELGSFLGMAGKWLRRRDFIDEGVVECEISAQLMPGWDNPLVEQGIILGNFGAYDEALQELIRAKETLPEETPHLQFSMGYVLMELSRPVDGLQEFEKVIQAQPDYALAYLYAARCAFTAGDKRKGQQYAKSARRLGEPGEYLAWRNGAYDPRRKAGAKTSK